MRSISCLEQQGMTLVEVMIALLIFSVGIMAVANMQITSMNSIATARKGIVNSVAAGGQMESILSKAYSDRLLIDRDDGFDPDSPDHGPFTIADSRSTIEWEVDDDFPAPNTKRIAVTVRWQGRGGVWRTFTYDYVKSRDFS